MDTNSITEQNTDVQNSSGSEPTLTQMMSKVDELLEQAKKEPEIDYKELVTKQNTVIENLQSRIKDLEDANLKLATTQSAPESNMTAEEIMLKAFTKE